MEVSSLIESSLRKIGALPSGEGVEASRQGDALHALQVMLRAWSAFTHYVFVSTRESIVLTPSKGEYLWGSGGDIDTDKPNSLIGAYLVYDGVTYPIELIGERQYDDLADKTYESIPEKVLFRANYPLAAILLHPVPSIAGTLYLSSYKPFTETSSFASVGDSIAFPVTYEEAIIYNLAIRLAPEYNKDVPLPVATIAKTSLDNIMIANAGARVEAVRIILPAGYVSSYDINAG